MEKSKGHCIISQSINFLMFSVSANNICANISTPFTLFFAEYFVLCFDEKFLSVFLSNYVYR